MSDVMTAGKIARFGIGNGARRFRTAHDPATGREVDNVDGDGNVIDGATAAQELNIQARALVAEQGLDYRTALNRTMAHPDNEPLVRAMNLRTGFGDRVVVRNHAAQIDDPDARNTASAKLHNLVVAALAKRTDLDKDDAVAMAKAYREEARRIVASPEVAPLRRSWAGQSE